MAKKIKLLYVVGGFSAGGAEKSLVSQLNLIDSNQAEIYAYIFNHYGLFYSQLPKNVKIIPAAGSIVALQHRPYDISFFIIHPLLWIKKIIRTTSSKLAKIDGDINQLIWAKWKKDIPDVDGEFDVVVGSQEGIPNYFAIDKVKANRKVLWIHSQYVKLNYNPQYDLPYFNKATAVITISEVCRQSLKISFPQLDNFVVLPNLTSSALIHRMAEEDVEQKFLPINGCNIISVGRLCYPKNFSLAISAAKILKQNGLKFRWLIIGEGADRDLLQKQIDKNGLSSNVLLIGVRANPYKYIHRADVAVITSEYEGKSIFADEAKILCKMLVSTNYDTVKDSITDGETGLIVDMTPASVALGIKKAYSDSTLIKRIISNLTNSNNDNIDQLENYYQIYFGKG